MLGLRFCARAFSSCGKRGPLFIAVRGPLTIAASIVAEHRLQTRRLSNCGSRAQLLRGMWDLPRPGQTEALNDTIDQIDLFDIHRTVHPKTADYVFFSSAHRTFSRIDHILGHESSLSKFKNIEIISSIFSDHNALRLEINYREKKTVKNTNTHTHIVSIFILSIIIH